MENATKQIIIDRAANIARSINLLSNLYHEIETLATSDEINEFIQPLFPFNASLDDLWADTEKWVQRMRNEAETERRAERYAKATAEPPIPAVFTLDGGMPYVGVHYPKYRWNGWCIPYFPLHEAIRFVAQQPIDSDIHWSYDEANDQFVCIEDQWKDDPEYTPDTYPAQEIDGIKYYSIGGCSYVWDAEQPKTFLMKDYSGRGYSSQITLIEICSDETAQQEYHDTDEDDRDETLIHWAMNAEIGDDYDYSEEATKYTRIS